MILEEVYPPKVVQVTNKFKPWHDTEAKELLEHGNEQLNKAIEHNCNKDWRLIRNLRIKLTKYLEIEKLEHQLKHI